MTKVTEDVRPQPQEDSSTTPGHPQLPVPISSFHRQASLLPTLSKPGHLTILASVLISARTQSGQSRSPQNRNLCKRVK